MAEGAVEVLLGKIFSLLEKETSFLGGVRHEFNEIMDELESTRSFLEDAGRRRESNEVVKIWVAELRDVAYDIEDIIDEFMYHMCSQRKGSGFRGFIRETIHLPKNVWVRHKIATKLQEINTKVKVISERGKLYYFDPVEEGMSSQDARGWLQHHREVSFFIEDEDLVGIDRQRDLLLGWLMEEEPQRTVISVCGMGGLGKTVLVAKVYQSEIVKRYFDCFAWITVSQSYAIEDLFRSMAKQFFASMKELFPLDLTKMNNRQLVETLVNYLRQKRYVVVLDDIWSSDIWSQINVALPDNGRGSRIMLTTEIEDIAASFSFGVGSHVHHIQPLQESEAWALFCKKAFSSDPNIFYPPEIEVLAWDIVKKCDGLPVALLAMGGLLSSKHQTISEWRNVYKSLNWELNNNPHLQIVSKILMLGYNKLPYYLKHCFLYCCIFPEGYLIRRKRLIRLWIAEGFVQESQGMTLEEVAESYFMELISRSMLLVTEKNHFGSPKACRMHYLMREVALYTSKTDYFCEVYEEAEIGDRRECRRLTIQNKSDIKIIQFRMRMSQLRSFLVFDGYMISPLPSNGFPSGFRLLRVLDLEGVPIESLPNELADLFNLRYLNLRETNVKELPKSLGRLQNLQTLDIRDSKVEALPSGIVKLQSLQYLNLRKTNVKELPKSLGRLQNLHTLDMRDSKVESLPKGIVKLQSLRHLITFRYAPQDFGAYNYLNATRVPIDVCELRNLQVLRCIEARGNIIKQIGNLTQLTRIEITKVRKVYGIDLCTSVQKMNLLRYLSVMAISEEETLGMDALLSPPPLLQTLILVGRLKKVPIWFRSLMNLTFLNLRWSRLREDPLPHIHDLPNLERLTLINAYEGEQLCFHAGRFLKLKTLQLGTLPQLNQIIIEEGAMPSIQKLELGSCKELKMVPQGIEHLTNLQKLRLTDASEELMERLRGENNDVDRPKVQHIPEINYYRTTPDGYERLPSSVNTS